MKKTFNTLAKLSFYFIIIQIIFTYKDANTQPQDTIIPGILYEIRNKETCKVLEVKNGSVNSKSWQTKWRLC